MKIARWPGDSKIRRYFADRQNSSATVLFMTVKFYKGINKLCTVCGVHFILCLVAIGIFNKHFLGIIAKTLNYSI